MQVYINIFRNFHNFDERIKIIDERIKIVDERTKNVDERINPETIPLLPLPFFC